MLVIAVTPLAAAIGDFKQRGAVALVQPDVHVAEQAVGALLDKGVKEEHLSLITRRQDFRLHEDEEHPGAAESSAKTGITLSAAARIPLP